MPVIVIVIVFVVAAAAVQKANFSRAAIKCAIMACSKVVATIYLRWIGDNHFYNGICDVGSSPDDIEMCQSIIKT